MENEVGCGSSSEESSENSTPDTSSSKMLQEFCLLTPTGEIVTPQTDIFGHLVTFSEIWPTSGMMQNGRFYPLPMSERYTKENVSLLWPTPTAQDAKNNAGPSQWDRNSYPLNVAVHGSREQQKAIGGDLNPTWVEWLMGFPAGWTDLRR